MTRWRLLTAAVCLARPLHAQVPPSLPSHVVRGVVFDSVARAPLAGALVQLTTRDSLGPVYSATTDSLGRFAIGGVPRGRFVIGFYHDALTALGFETSIRAVDVADADEVTADLGIPRVQALAGVTVTAAATPPRMSPAIEHLLLRQRIGAGTIFLRGDAALDGADRVMDVLRFAKGFREKGDGTYVGRPSATMGPHKTPCSIRVYVDGERVPDGLKAIDHLVLVRDVVGVEAYQDIAFAPVEWRYGGDDNACSIVAVWTNRKP